MDDLRRRRWPSRLALLLVLAFVAGCGLTAQSRPEPVQTSPVEDSAALAPPLSTEIVQIYLVRAERLVAVPRAGRTVSDAIASLSAGPTALDSEAGLNSPLTGATVELAAEHNPEVVTVEMTPEFARLPEHDAVPRRGAAGVDRHRGLLREAGTCCTARRQPRAGAD